ncbi:MAG: moderate conductance mechanosensitive channel [Clostridia bacterium]|jgi:small conductance mechanosensitive channel|nr:moderate conductance mechanosensitive channel [Clostridia bacterium]
MEFINFQEFFNIIDPKEIILLGYSFLKVIGIFIISRVVYKFGAIAIDQMFKDRFNLNEHLKVEQRRIETLSRLLKSLLSYLLYFIAIVTSLKIFGVPIETVLAGAGILGLAVGFGAQNLVKDIISGFFIIFEDLYAVGEYIKIDDKFGMVEEIGLKTTKIRAWTGELYMIPNGSVEQVTNYNRGSMRSIVEVGIAYEEDIDNAIKVIEKACDKVYLEMQEVIDEKPNVMGVIALADSSVNIRVTATAKGLNHWALERKLRQRIKEEFDKEGVEIPYPRRVIINGGELETGS